MTVDKTTADRLAKAWFAESKRIQTVDVPCYCGCGEIIRPRARRFRSGHPIRLPEFFQISRRRRRRR